jgi:hypothetical protein
VKILRPVRLLLLALLVSLIPASSFAGVFISVGFAPPVLPEYDQPPCPEEGLMWTPGYWAYGEEGYYWVPGTWVPAPYEGALWTPPYWGWQSGLYMFHPGYWGRHVGYYGGVNYGFGYMGIGFVGGMWRGRDFVYNTAVMRVDDRRIHNIYVDRGSVDRYTVARGSRVAFSGGPGGIRHDAAPEERFAERDQHTGATSFQHSHESSAMSDRSSYFRNNNGRPSNPAMARPADNGVRNQNGGGDQGRGNYNSPRSNGGYSQDHPAPQPQYRQAPQQNDRGGQQGQQGGQPQYRQTPQQYDRGGQQHQPNASQPSAPQPQYRQVPQQYDRGGQQRQQGGQQGGGQQPHPQGGQPQGQQGGGQQQQHPQPQGQQGGKQEHDNGDHKDHQH